MSVRTSERVWASSKHSGSELLMLLALADFADDRGNAYPAVSTLAEKCRMTARNANHILAALRASGELEIRTNEGPKGTNRYRITIGDAHPTKRSRPLKQASPPQAVQPLKPTSSPAPEAGFTPEARFTLKPASSTPEAGFLKPLKPASDEPSLNRHEPSGVARQRAARTSQSMFEAASLALPDWLDADAWKGWVADRRERRKVITERGAEQQLRKLAEYRAAGHDPVAVIRHSIANGYQGLYPEKAASPSSRTRQPVLHADDTFGEAA